MTFTTFTGLLGECVSLCASHTMHLLRGEAASRAKDNLTHENVLRYTPQSNWGQSLEYNHEAEQYPWYRGHASFDEIVAAMGKLIEEGKIRGYGSCNDNAVGLMGMAAVAKRLGVPGPCTMQVRAHILTLCTDSRAGTHVTGDRYKIDNG